VSWLALPGHAVFVGTDRGVPAQYVTGRIHQRLLAARITTAAEPPDRGGTTGDNYWLGQARRALMMGDHHTAVYAAGIARQHYGESASMWNLLARADAGLGRFADAVLEARCAVRLAPGEAEHHLVLAGVLEELGNWNAAMQCYHLAERLDPDSGAARTGQASVLLRTGDVGRAVHILEASYARGRDRSTVGDHLALALVAAAEQTPRIRDGDTYLVTGADEVTRMRALLSRAADVAEDRDVRVGVASVRRYVDMCAHREWVPARAVGGTAGRAAWLAVAAFLVPAAGVVAGVVHEVGMAVWVTLALAVAATVGLVQHGRVPRWKLNRWARDEEVAGPLRVGRRLLCRAAPPRPRSDATLDREREASRCAMSSVIRSPSRPAGPS
jgi:Flp pilus assembly protein TadD